MDDLAKVSIIVPVYNAEQYIKKLINCILEQTYTNYEIIFIDDGSSDKSADIIKKKTVGCENVIYYYQKNSGVSSARNKGLELMSSIGYVLFIDADDQIENDFIEKMVKTAIQEEKKLVSCKYYGQNDINIPYQLDKYVAIPNISSRIFII